MAACGVCKNQTATAKVIGTVTVTMCRLCDARQCSDKTCNGYTSDPTAKECVRCRKPFSAYTAADHPPVCDGDPDSIHCRHCGNPRTLEGPDKTVGRRVLVCWTCDVPKEEAEPLVELGTG